MSLEINTSVASCNLNKNKNSQYYLTEGTEKVIINRVPTQLRTPSTNAVCAELGISETESTNPAQRTNIVKKTAEIDKIYGPNSVLSIYKEPVSALNRDFFLAYKGINLK